MIHSWWVTTKRKQMAVAIWWNISKETFKMFHFTYICNYAFIMWSKAFLVQKPFLAYFCKPMRLKYPIMNIFYFIPSWIYFISQIACCYEMLTNGVYAMHYDPKHFYYRVVIPIHSLDLWKSVISKGPLSYLSWHWKNRQ